MVKFAHTRPRACVYKIFFVPLRREKYTIKIITNLFLNFKNNAYEYREN